MKKYRHSSLVLLCISNSVLASHSSVDKSSRIQDQLKSGSEGCPCINPWKGNPNVTFESGSPCRAITFESGVTECVSLDYGADECKSWSLEDEGDGGNTSSSSKWCFIDRENCDRPNYHAQIKGMDDLYLSFETCGNIRQYDENVYSFALKGKTLRVGLPGEGSSAYEYNFPRGEDTLDPEGSIVEFFEQIALEAGFDYTYHTRSNVSTAVYPNSTYSSCVHDVAIGFVDMCIGPFWALPSRIMQTPMTSSFFRDEFYLVVPTLVTSEKSLWSILATPFKPFSPLAWLTIILVFIYISIILLLMTMKHDYREHKVVNTFKNFGKHVAYNSILNFSLGVNAELFMSERGHASFQRLVIVGSAIFGLLMKSLYVSSLAASFVLKDSTVTQYNSLEDIVSNGGNICVDELVAASFLSTYGHILPPGSVSKLPQKQHIALTDADLITDLNPNALCTSILILEDAFNAYRSNGQFCSASFIDRPMISLGVTFPISDKFDTELNYLISKKVIDGSYDTLRRKFKSSYEKDSCSANTHELEEMDRRLSSLTPSYSSSSFPSTSQSRSLSQLSSNEPSTTNSKASEKKAIGVLEILGPIIFAVGFATFGLGLFLWDTYIKPNLDDRKLHEASQEKNASTTHRNLGTDVLLKKELQAMTVLELIETLQKSDVDLDSLDMAYSKLPDTSALVALAFELECTETTKNVLYLEELSIRELLEMARKCVDKDILKNALTDERPRRKLIELLSGEFETIKLYREENWQTLKTNRARSMRFMESLRGMDTSFSEVMIASGL